jgi:hypothetical protein
MNAATAAIAKHLNVAESAIVRVEEWATVLFAVVKGIGARFVSKKVVEDKVMEVVETALGTAVRIAKRQNELMDLWNRHGDESAMDEYHGLTEAHDAAFRSLSKEQRREYMRLVD